MMYVWNGFPIVSKRKDLSENLLVTVEKAEAALQNESKYGKLKPGSLNHYHLIIQLISNFCVFHPSLIFIVTIIVYLDIH